MKTGGKARNDGASYLRGIAPILPRSPPAKVEGWRENRTLIKPSDIENGLNYLVDTLAFSGSALLLARILPKEAYSGRSLEEGSKVAVIS